MFRVKPRTTLGRLIFTILIQKSEDSGKSLGKFWRICPWEVPRVIRLSLGAAPFGKVWLPSGPPKGKFYQTTLWTFHCLYQSLTDQEGAWGLGGGDNNDQEWCKTSIVFVNNLFWMRLKSFNKIIICSTFTQSLSNKPHFFWDSFQFLKLI